MIAIPSDAVKRSRRAESRGKQRHPVTLPAIAIIGLKSHSVRVMNLTAQGAMLQTTGPLATGFRITLRCGAITADACVAWTAGDRIGVSFDRPLPEGELTEQLSRSSAISTRRDPRAAYALTTRSI